MTAGWRMQDPAPTRLARKLNTFDALVIGLGAMIGAGVFAVVGPPPKRPEAGCWSRW